MKQGLEFDRIFHDRGELRVALGRLANVLLELVTPSADRRVGLIGGHVRCSRHQCVALGVGL
jgi:hypothetical protein